MPLTNSAPALSSQVALETPATPGVASGEPVQQESVAAPVAPAPISIPEPAYRRTLVHGGDVFAIAFEPKGELLASACNDHRARLWTFAAGTLRRTFSGHRDGVSSVAFRADGTELVAGSFDGTAKSWTAATGKPVATTPGPDEAVDSLAVDPAGKRLALGGASGKISVVDTEDETARFELAGHTGAVRALAFAHSHDWLLSRSDDGWLVLWDVARRAPLQRMQVSGGAVWAAIFTNDDRHVVTTWEPGKTASVGVWDTATGQRTREWPLETYLAPSVALSPDGRLLAVGTGEGNLELWDFAAATRLHVLRHFKSNLNAVAFSPDGKYLAAGGYDNAIGVWEMAP